uniref:Uncharacterized protein n=1 Tax=Lepeophtheirus salmonis TaxID=72036 RepID=A0A0K2U7R2_LEPSM
MGFFHFWGQKGPLHPHKALSRNFFDSSLDSPVGNSEISCMGPHRLDRIGTECFLQLLRVRFSLFDRALLSLQRFRLANGVDGGPRDTQLLGVRE